MTYTLDLKEANRLVKRFVMPTRPTVILQAVKIQNQWMADPRQVRATIVRDVALVAQVLQAANTRLPGYQRQVESLESAIVLLGQDRLREATQDLFLTAEMARRESWTQNLRVKSIRAGALASWMAGQIAERSPGCQSGYLPIVPPDEAYVAGLLHDCGQLVMLRHFADYPQLLDVAARPLGVSLEMAEMERYQMTHALLSALLCELWQLPKALVYTIEGHHQTDAFAGRPVKERKYMVMHAILLLTEWAEGDLSEWEWQRHQEYIERMLGLTEEVVRQIRQEAQQWLATELFCRE
ncbi:HDOD domain-containing protein [Candidatus Magnetaquicoccus inordinatus]|uniref:HDOD domain-containing protein n=1 Tax=Candidatus Magnetaquicoccus inordinatus TaxID=2496818 RepID=UPI00187D55C8|nr:HDOD domain-containing protein [Candidatus Magnetaquicoccus inordinatus]